MFLFFNCKDILYLYIYYNHYKNQFWNIIKLFEVIIILRSKFLEDIYFYLIFYDLTKHKI